MKNRIYAWVKTETCAVRDAVLPGSYIGRNPQPVSRHGDYTPWFWGKRETLAIIDSHATAANRYRRQCAHLVADLLGWN